jgi:hypothetical protein
MIVIVMVMIASIASISTSFSLVCLTITIKLIERFLHLKGLVIYLILTIKWLDWLISLCIRIVVTCWGLIFLHFLYLFIHLNELKNIWLINLSLLLF